MENQFVINKRFNVNEAVNSVTDLETGLETRLEPRLMKLIMLLVKHKGEVVTRQQMITDIWDDYGNADEGLSQGVSYLRKILADTEKQLIRTIPKKGYMLDGTVSAGTTAEPIKSQDFPHKSGKLYIITVPIILVVTITWFLLSRPSGGPAEPPGSVIDTTYQYKEMKDTVNQMEQKDVEAEKKMNEIP